MIRKIILTNLITLGAILVSENASANQIGYSLDELISSSDVIVLGSSRSDRTVMESYGVRVYLVSFEISECFKRKEGPIVQVGNSLKLLNSSGGPERPIIKNGENYILFLQQSEVGLYPFGALSGVLPVLGDKVLTSFVIGEPAEQKLDSLRSRLVSGGKNFGCTDTWITAPKN